MTCFRYDTEHCYISNEEMGLKDYVTGFLPTSSSSPRTHIYVREANYHPDSGEVRRDISLSCLYQNTLMTGGNTWPIALYNYSPVVSTKYKNDVNLTNSK